MWGVCGVEGGNWKMREGIGDGEERGREKELYTFLLVWFCF